MKQAKIQYKMTKNGRVLFVGYANVMTCKDLFGALSNRLFHEYFNGRSFCSLDDVGKKGIRISEPRESDRGTHYRDYNPGEEYTTGEWQFFVKFIKEAGTRFSKIHADQNRLYTVSI